MKFLLDTNILIIYLRDRATKSYIEEHFHPFDLPNIPIVSVVTVGEIKAFSTINHWGAKRLEKMEEFLKQVVIADINSKDVIENYAKIDAFSQGKLTNRPLGMSSRNMGKNDLWIAATAAATGATLLTTDTDFSHLDKVFFSLQTVHLVK